MCKYQSNSLAQLQVYIFSIVLLSCSSGCVHAPAKLSLSSSQYLFCIAYKPWTSDVRYKGILIDTSGKVFGFRRMWTKDADDTDSVITKEVFTKLFSELHFERTIDQDSVHMYYAAAVQLCGEMSEQIVNGNDCNDIFFFAFHFDNSREEYIVHGLRSEGNFCWYHIDTNSKPIIAWLKNQDTNWRHCNCLCP